MGSENTKQQKAPGTQIGGLPGTASVNDANLLNFVRENATRIVTALSYRASMYGERGDWGEMHTNMALADQIATSCNLTIPSIVGNYPQQRALAAGTGT